MQGRYIVALQNTVDHRYVTDLLQKRFPEYEIYTGKDGECIDLIDISRVRSTSLRLHVRLCQINCVTLNPNGQPISAAHASKHPAFATSDALCLLQGHF